MSVRQVTKEEHVKECEGFRILHRKILDAMQKGCWDPLIEYMNARNMHIALTNQLRERVLCAMARGLTTDIRTICLDPIAAIKIDPDCMEPLLTELLGIFEDYEFHWEVEMARFYKGGDGDWPMVFDPWVNKLVKDGRGIL